MYHDDTQYFGEDCAKGADSTAIALVVGNKLHDAFVNHLKQIESALAKFAKAFEVDPNLNKLRFSENELIFTCTRKWGKTSFFQQFGRAIRIKPKSNYFDRVPANTRLAKSTVFKRMRDLS